MKITQKEATLFVKSEVSNEYGNIKNAMINNHQNPSLSEAEFQLLSKLDKEFLNRRFYDLLDKAGEEWKIESHDIENDTGITKCQLCSQKPIKKISIIKNKINGTKLIIGSSCVNDFDKITDKRGKNSKELKKEGYVHKNEQKLLEIDNTILKDMDRFSKIQKERTVLTKYLNRECKRLKIKQNDCAKLLMQKTFNDEKIDKIIKLHEEIKRFLFDFDKYDSDSETRFFGINRKIDAWCLNNYSYDLVEDLSEKGEIDIYTIASIKEPDFLKRMIIALKPLIEKNNMNLLPNFGVNKFHIIFNNYSNIIFDIDSSKFIGKYRGYLFQKTEYKIEWKDILKIGKISDRKSLNKALKLICDDNYFSIRFDDTEIDEIAFYNKISKIYSVVSFKNFVNEFIRTVLNEESSSQNLEQINNHIRNNSTPYSHEEYKNHLKSLGIKFN